MKIAVYSDNFHPELSGITDSITTIAPALAERGHEIRIFAPRYSSADYGSLHLPVREPEFGPRITTVRFPSLPFRTGTQQGRLVIPLCRTARIREFRPDIIHCHLPFGTGLEGFIAAKRLKVPLVGTNHTATRAFALAHGSPRWIADLGVRYATWFYDRCDFVSSPCQAIFEEMADLNALIPRQVVSNPLDTRRFYPLLPAKRAGLKKKYGFSNFTLAYAGRIAPEKNISDLLRAAAALRTDIPELSVVIIGKGPDESRLRQLVRQLHLDRHVLFPGFLAHAELAEAYAASDVFLMPSTSETQSLSTMQAMLCGLPILAADAMGLKDYVPPQAGYRLKPGDVQGYREKVLHLYHRPGERARLGEGARIWAEKFDTARVAGLWEDIYARLLGKTPVKPGQKALKMVG